MLCVVVVVCACVHGVSTVSTRRGARVRSRGGGRTATATTIPWVSPARLVRQRFLSAGAYDVKIGAIVSSFVARLFLRRNKCVLSVCAWIRGI